MKMKQGAPFECALFRIIEKMYIFAEKYYRHARNKSLLWNHHQDVL